MNKKEFNFKRVITHSTVFHADDVFGAAMCKLIDPYVQIIRTLEPEEFADDETLIFDIGMGEYDHHQQDKAVRPISDGYYTDKQGSRQPVPYCGFGLLWRDFGHLLCPDPMAWQRVDRELVIPIDKADNGISQNPLSTAIRNMNPAWDRKSLKIPIRPLDKGEVTEDYYRVDGVDYLDTRFSKAMQLAMTVLSQSVEQANAAVRAIDKVSESYGVSPSEKILVLDQYMPYLDVIRDEKYKDLLFVVYPSQRGGWNVQTVPKAPGSTSNRMDFPTGWLGHANPERGIHFAHTSNFLIACDTKDQAIKVAEEAIDIGSDEAVVAYSFDC